MICFNGALPQNYHEWIQNLKKHVACQLQYFQACVAQGCVGQHRMSSANKFTFQHHCPQFCHLSKSSPTQLSRHSRTIWSRHHSHAQQVYPRKEKKAVAKQRNNSMRVTILPSLCGSRMCWSAQDVLCQQVYFSTSLPPILPSLQILPNLIAKGSLNEKLPSSGV